MIKNNRLYFFFTVLISFSVSAGTCTETYDADNKFVSREFNDTKDVEKFGEYYIIPDGEGKIDLIKTFEQLKKQKAPLFSCKARSIKNSYDNIQCSENISFFNFKNEYENADTRAYNSDKDIVIKDKSGTFWHFYWLDFKRRGYDQRPETMTESGNFNEYFFEYRKNDSKINACPEGFVSTWILKYFRLYPKDENSNAKPQSFHIVGKEIEGPFTRIIRNTESRSKPNF
jgi:hypothetical protein